MFPLLMTHPKHGAMYAHDHSEVERLEKAGWSEASAPVSHVAPKEPEVLAVAKRKYVRKAA